MGLGAEVRVEKGAAVDPRRRPMSKRLEIIRCRQQTRLLPMDDRRGAVLQNGEWTLSRALRVRPPIRILNWTRASLGSRFLTRGTVSQR